MRTPPFCAKIVAVVRVGSRDARVLRRRHHIRVLLPHPQSVHHGVEVLADVRLDLRGEHVALRGPDGLGDSHVVLKRVQGAGPRQVIRRAPPRQ